MPIALVTNREFLFSKLVDPRSAEPPSGTPRCGTMEVDVAGTAKGVWAEVGVTEPLGGIETPCVMKLPGRIRAGSSSAMFSTVDLLPTIAHLTGASLPANEIDGRNVWDLVVGTPGATNPHAYYPFSTGRVFEGVISGDGRWKSHLPHQYRTLVQAGNDGSAGTYRQATIERSLFDMVKDPLETTDVLRQNPDVARRLGEFAEAHRARFYAEQERR